MQTIITGIFLVLHGLVHLLYFGQSRRLFELRPKMVWPDGSWAFSKLVGDTRSSPVDETTRLLASVALVLAAIGFMAGGLGLFI